MTHRLTTNYAKNYCNRTLIVKVIVDNVVTCFFGTRCTRDVDNFICIIFSLSELKWWLLSAATGDDIAGVDMCMCVVQIRLSSRSAHCCWTMWTGWRQTISCLEIQPYSPLHQLLPPKRSKPYLTRGRVHNYILPSKTTTLDECNFTCRLLYKDCFYIIQLA